ncbi:LamG-like jellyroll fold domain-containing protein [Streptacidiphilus griseoplanus]|uniref:LamG-like jellyroll fold domain-containing protein n=1 Tax=Peterkaempfera griseoplana TaxID=66896 RepID=UPI0006E16831|nr:LamG-like jellyroll fold domain-containing protein [Peterkaempfera griseoplana]
MLVAALVAGAAPAVGLAGAGQAGAAVPAETVKPVKSAGAGAHRTALTESAAVTEATGTGQKVEISSLLTESSETYATPDGGYEMDQHLRPVRARVGGAWKAIDNTLVKRPDGSVGPAVAAVGLTLSGGGPGPLVTVERAGRKLSYTWPSALPAPQLNGDTATYADVLPGVDLQMRADVDGFHELVVVNSAAAARNPALKRLTLGVRATGLTLSRTKDGGLQATDSADGGGVVFAAPKPIMWDSSTGTAAGAAARSTSAGAAEAKAKADPRQGPTGTSRVAPIAAAVDSKTSQLTLTPDQSLLTGATYPLYIDPQTYTPKAGDWTMVSKYWASSPQYRFNGDSDEGVGYCGWSYCAPYDTKRLFYSFPTSRFAGKSILSATFIGHETWSPSCSARKVELWRTKGFTSGTTWNSSSDNWLERLDTVSTANGYSGCAASDVEFDATTGVKYAASHNSSTTTFGLRATDESDAYGWKRFSDDAYLRVHYNLPPKQISMSQLSMSPGGSCHSPSSPVRIGSLPSITAGNVTDPDGDQVSVQFELSWDAGDGKGFTTQWTSAKIGPKKSGSTFSTKLTATLSGKAIPKNKTIGWAVRAQDYDEGKYYSYSPWSYTGSATDCYWVYDTSVPAGPVITSGDYPAVNDSDPNDPSYDGVGRDGSFTLDSTATDVVKYCYGVNADAVCDADHTVATTGGAAKSVTFRPTRAGTNFVYAQAWDSAGNASEPEVYEFRVKEGQPAEAQWQLDDAAGATQAAGTAGDRTLSVTGSPTLGAPGKVGTGIDFNGTDSYLASDIPTVHTDISFSVAAWVKLDRMPTTAAIIAAQPGNDAPGFELYYSQAYDRWVFNQYTADTATATPVRAMASTAGGVTAGQWYHLVGSYSYGDKLLSLYVNGQLVGTTSYSTPWDARRGLQIGAGNYSGTAGSFFPGTIDDVRIFDKPLVATDVTHLYKGEPLGTGRPARAVFPLDEGATQTDGTATTQVTGRADVEPAVLHGGATAGSAGAQNQALTLDGTTGYAATRSSHVNNVHSYSVVAWAKLSTKPSHAAIIATQAGTYRPGFELYYSATYGWSFDAYTADSDTADIVRAAQGDTTHSPAGVWTQLLGSYDANTDDMRLYINGAWVATTTFAAPFYGGGATQIGAGSYDGAPGSFFPGQIDDVQLFDRALSAPEAAAMYDNQLQVQGRWGLESATGTPQVSPDSLATAADRHPLTLGSGAQIDATGGSSVVGMGALVLNGTSTGYASTSASPIHTNTSFTVSAWVSTPARPTKPVTVMSMAGTNANGFAVRYVPDSTDPVNAGSWQLQMANADSTSATVSTAPDTSFQNNGAWDHLTVVYDLMAGQMRLYVNGELQQNLCADSDDNGTPDDPTCTETVSWNSSVLPFDATKGLQLGRIKTGTSTWGEYWPGVIDDVWTFTGVASDTQIAALASGVDLDTTTGP